MVRTRTPGVDGEAHEIVVYATGSTTISEPEHDARRHRGSGPGGATPVGDQLRRAATVVHDGFDHARGFHAKAGPRMGSGVAVATVREGTKSEIVRPILLDPRQAWELAGSGQLFVDPIPRLSIDHQQDPAPAGNPVWAASLRVGWVKRRAAQLQVSASPSFNVTVLELLPATRRRIGGRSFLRAGLPVVEELARRLEDTRARDIVRDEDGGESRDAPPRAVVSPGHSRDS